VFDEVTKKESGKNAARRAGFILGSTVFQGILVTAIIAASAYVKAKVLDEPKVEVKFVKAAAPPKPPPPPAAPKPKRPPSDKPRTDLPKPPPPTALIQPQDVKAEMKAPDPNQKEPEYDWGGSDDGEEGVVGGVAGGGGIEDAPAFATAGYRKPQMAVPKCVQEATRIPRDLAGFISGPITVKFAVLRDGSPGQFSVITNGIPDRIQAAIWQAVQECKWIAGADPQGKPTNIWVILPLRFTAG
jgi:periplasmic protein TonB